MLSGYVSTIMCRADKITSNQKIFFFVDDCNVKKKCPIQETPSAEQGIFSPQF